MREDSLNKAAGIAGKDGRPPHRQLTVEMLRLSAILGIALFHTFQPWFAALIDGSLIREYPGLGFLSNPAFLTAMGCIDQLGAWGNHVFIMISGCFLLPRAAGRSLGGEHRLMDGFGEAARRSIPIVLTAILYASIALLAGKWFPDVTGLSLDYLGWLAQGLQFIWICLILVCLCPIIGLLWGRCRHQTRLLAAVTLVIYGVILYIAFVSPGDPDRSLFEWRKIMSGATYALSFVMGGWLSERFRGESRGFHGDSAGLARKALIVSVGLTVIAEVCAALSGDLRLVEALSFKSTSPLACAMAASALAFSLCIPPEAGERHPKAVELTAHIASGALGFYVLQALFSMGWHEVSNALLAEAIGAGPLAFLAMGAAFSAVLLAVLIGFDVLFRQRLFERLGLR